MRAIMRKLVWAEGHASYMRWALRLIGCLATVMIPFAVAVPAPSFARSRQLEAGRVKPDGVAAAAHVAHKSPQRHASKHKTRHHRHHHAPPRHRKPLPAQPTLVVCAGGNFYKVAQGSSANVRSPFAYGPSGQYSFENNLGGCDINADISPSPGFVRWAQTSETSDGSIVAGYVNAGTPSFFNLSGHYPSYSGQTVTDSDPMFSPTGKLWWNDAAGQLWYAAPPGGQPVDWGAGQLLGFLPNGDPSPGTTFVSPTGKTVALVEFDDSADGQPSTMYLASPSELSGSCLEAAEPANGIWPYTDDGGNAYYPVAASCPGAAYVSGTAPDCQFAGMISDTSFACLVADPDGATYYESIPFSISASQISFGSPTRLTPPTVLSVANIGVSPDGTTLWYDLNLNSGARALYEVPTSRYTANPRRYSPTITADGRKSAVADADLEGWLWHARYSQLEPPLFPGED